MFSCEFCNICKNIFFIEHLRWLLLSSEKTNWHISFKQNDGVMYNTLGLRGNHTHKHKYFQSNLPFWKSPFYSKNISFLYIRISSIPLQMNSKETSWERSPLFWFNQSISRWIFFQKQPPEVFYKKGVLRNFAKFTGKHLRQSLAQVLYCEFCKISKNSFFYRARLGDCFWTFYDYAVVLNISTPHLFRSLTEFWICLRL